MEKLELALAWFVGFFSGWWARRWWGLRRVKKHFDDIQKRNRQREQRDSKNDTNGWSK